MQVLYIMLVVPRIQMQFIKEFTHSKNRKTSQSAIKSSYICLAGRQGEGSFPETNNNNK